VKYLPLTLSLSTLLALCAGSVSVSAETLVHELAEAQQSEVQVAPTSVQPVSVTLPDQIPTPEPIQLRMVREGGNQVRMQWQTPAVSIDAAIDGTPLPLAAQIGTPGQAAELVPIVPDVDPFPKSEVPVISVPSAANPRGISIPIRIVDGVTVAPYISPFGQFDVGVVLRANIIGQPSNPVRVVTQDDLNPQATADQIGAAWQWQQTVRQYNEFRAQQGAE